MLVSAGAELVFDTQSVDTQPAATAREVIARYPFHNNGPTAVRVKSVRSDCSCTSPTLAKETYAPGEAGEVVVKFEIGNRHGPQKKAVIVSTDDPARPTQILTLTAALPQMLTLSTDALLWTAGEVHAAKSIVVKTPAEPAVTAVRAQAQSPALRVEVERVSATEYRLQISPAADARDISSALYVDAILADGLAKRSTAFIRVR